LAVAILKWMYAFKLKLTNGNTGKAWAAFGHRAWID
jgi:hypothetical protein